MKKKIILASGSRHTIPPINSSPGVARVISTLAENETKEIKYFVVSKYDKSIDNVDFDNLKYFHPKPTRISNILGFILDKTPYRIKKKIFGFTQTDRIIYYRGFKKIIKEINPDIIVTFMHIELFKILKKEFPKTKHIYFYRSTDIEGRLGLRNIQYLFKSCDGILANTKLAIEEFKKFNPIDKLLLETVYNAVELNNKLKLKDISLENTYRAKFNLNNKDFILGYAGRFSHEKSLLELLEAIYELKKKKIKVHLFIAGDINNEKTPDLIYYENILKYVNCHLKDQVYFLGWINSDELFDFYSGIDLGILLSKYREGNSMFLTESLSVGTPVIATNIGGNIEIIQDNKNSFLIDNTDIVNNLVEKISFLYSNSKILQEVSINAKEYAKKNHSTKVMTKNFNSFIERFI